MRRVLITGGTGGIGFGIAEAMLADSWAVTVTGLTRAEVEALPSRPNLSAVVLDVTSEEAVVACLADFGRLDALVTCAGIILRNGEEFTPEGFARVVDVNLTGTMRVCLAARPLLAAAQGAIVTTASMLSFFGGPAVPAYSASKGGVVQLTKALAVAWAPHIRVNAVAPGWIETPLTRPLREDEARSAAILARTPFRRWGTPGDVGGAVAFLCSEAARFVTGIVLPVDGGYTAA